MHRYEEIPRAAVEDTVVPARGSSRSRRIDKGQVLRIVDLEGRQAVDFLCYNAHDTEDRYAAADTMKIDPGRYFPFDGLGSLQRRPNAFVYDRSGYLRQT